MALREQAWVEEIGMAVEDVREAARLTQEELGELLGLSKQTISNIERGYSGTNNLTRLKAIAEACAGKGWLADDPIRVRQYLLGDATMVPLTMQRRKSEPLKVIEGRPKRRRSSAASRSAKGYIRLRHPDQEQRALAS